MPPELKAEKTPLTCSCCDLPYAHLHRTGDGMPVLLIASRHKGDTHTNVVTADDLRRWLAEMESSMEVTSGR